MHEELIRELSVITEEEQHILDGRKEIDPQLYTEKKDMVIDSKSFSRRGSLFRSSRTRGSFISRSTPITISK